MVSRGNETEIGEFVVSHEELNKESLLKKLSDLSDQTKANDLNVATLFVTVREKKYYCYIIAIYNNIYI